MQKILTGYKKFSPEIEEALLGYRGEDRIVTFKQKQDELARIQEPEIKILTGLPTLDKWLLHSEPGDVVTISGPTGNGKTLLAQTFTMNMYMQEQYGLWFSYELTPKQFLGTFPDLPDLAFMPNKMTTGAMDWVEERIYEAKVKSNDKVRVVYIDHLHFLVDMVSRQNMSIQIGTILRTLKRIAQEYKVCIILIAHTGKIQRDQDPDGENIRDSSFIRQESDTVLIVWRIKKENQAKILVDKCRRNGAAYRKVLLVKKQNGLLFEIEEFREEPEQDKRRTWWDK